MAILLFSDLVDSTAMLARLGDDQMDRMRKAHHDDVTAAVTAGGDGRVVKFIGDGAMATFSSALAGLRAAAAIQASVERLDAANGGIGLAVRVGVSAGEPIADGDDLHGMAVVIAARLCGAAQTGEVLVQDLVRTLAASRDGVSFANPRPYDLKGISAPVSAVAFDWRGVALPELSPPTAMAAAEPPALPRVLAAYANQPLVGRDEELVAVREAIAFTESRSTLLLLGEPGIGKTRLAASAATAAREGGALVVLARCPPEAAVAFAPWVRAISELALSSDRGALAAAAGPELAALVPELADVAPDRPAATEAEGARYRLLRGVGAALTHAAAGRPLCLVLDDAHWCDAASAQVLVEILERSPAHRLALIVTARERELGRGHVVSRALADLRRTRELRELRLTGLEASGIAALVSARLGRSITPRLARGLLSRTNGNPFFAGELAQDLDERGDLREDALDGARVPEAVAGLVNERLARLDPETERFLVTAAAIGPTASIALTATASGLDPSAAAEAVAQAVAERLVDEAPALEPAVSFPHALVREAFADMLELVPAARLHHAIAEALAADLGTEPAALARHRALAAPITGPEPAVHAHREAAAFAAREHDHEGAAGHLDAALALLPAVHADRGELLLEVGDQRSLAANLRLGRVAYLGAAEAAREAGDPLLLARAAIGFAGGEAGFAWEAGGDDPQTLALLLEALEAIGDHAPRVELGLVFRVLYNGALSGADMDRDPLVRRLEMAVARLEGPEVEVIAAMARFVAQFARNADAITGYVQETKGLAAALQAHVDELPDGPWLMRCHTWGAHAAYVIGDVERRDAHVESATQLAERMGSPRYVCEAQMLVGQKLFDDGDPTAGTALIEQAGAGLSQLRPDLQATIVLLGQAIRTQFYGGDLLRTVAVLRSLVIGNPWSLLDTSLVQMLALAGEREEAWAGLDELLDGDPEVLRRADGHRPFAISQLAYATALTGHPSAGERLLPELRRLRGLVLVAAPGVSWGHVPEFAIGWLELVAGRHEQAVVELHTAVERFDVLQIVWGSAWSRIILARALHRSGDASDAEAAGRTLAEASCLLDEFGLEGLRRQLEEVRAELDGRALATVVTSAPTARPVRALAARSGRRALAAMVRKLDDRALEERFLPPRRQRSLLRALARGFQPAHAYGFQGVIAYEIEPFSVEAPDAPWRWAIEVDGKTARVIEPAPLDAAVTIHFGLADWVRVIAGEQDPVVSMAQGRCRVDGDIEVAAVLEPMFGAR